MEDQLYYILQQLLKFILHNYYLMPKNEGGQKCTALEIECGFSFSKSQFSSSQ
jgi:hypothetical protein